MRRLLAAAVLAAVVGCGGGNDTIHGLVVGVEGDLQHGISSFSVRADDGELFTFVPAPGLAFDGAPLTHLSAHLAAAQAVLVDYEEDSRGILVATRVTDG